MVELIPTTFKYKSCNERYFTFNSLILVGHIYSSRQLKIFKRIPLKPLFFTSMYSKLNSLIQNYKIDI